MICAACRIIRDPADLLAFWPLGQPEARRFVCRPTCAARDTYGPCFHRVVGPMNVHAIALAAPQAPASEAAARVPVLPFTPAWFGLMREAGVRAA